MYNIEECFGGVIMNHDYIDIKGARENNLKNIDLKIPRDKFVIMTGVSGSGKTSLAFDTIYAEGQRRYVESLSAYARQFLGNSEKPDVDSIDWGYTAFLCRYYGRIPCKNIFRGKTSSTFCTEK